MNRDIQTVQQLLINHGFSVGPAGADGVWGPGSQRGLVQALQLAMGASAAADPDDDDRELLEELCEDEGTVLHAYQDHLGYWTIGTGRLIDKRRGGGISKAENDMLLMADIRRCRAELDARIPWWRKLDPVRRRVMQNLIFNMGWGDGTGGLSSFRNTLKAIEAGDWDRAAVGLASSRWATQVQKSRRDRIIRQIRTGA